MLLLLDNEMKLTLQNFAKIDHADIILDGLTVIAGENNTGKSTIGKVLFSVFDALYYMEERKFLDKLSFVRMALYRAALKANADFNYDEIEQQLSFFRKEHVVPSNEQLVNVFCTIAGRSSDDVDFCDVMQKILSQRDKIDNSILECRMISNVFRSTFNQQINSLQYPDTEARIDLDIKKNNVRLVFRDDVCRVYNSDLKIKNKAVYLANPDVISKTRFSHGDYTQEALYSLLNESSVESSVSDSLLTEGKFVTIIQKLHSVLPGRFVTTKDNPRQIELLGCSNTLKVSNLSTGLKSFALLRILIEQNKIREKDILILDEPEIHLHPRWQVIYAEIIVLLRKEFDLTIVVTTHSPYFLDAIHLYSILHGVNDSANYYLTEQLEQGGFSLSSVTENIELIYRKMLSAVELLDTLRHKLEYNVE